MTPFEKFQKNCQNLSTADALSQLATDLIDQQRFHELFEIRKMQMRWRLGLPIGQWQSIDDLPDEQGKSLEDGLLNACREIGAKFFEIGDVQSGWQYLQPVGDKRLIGELLRGVEVTDENVEAVIEVSVGHGIDPPLGVQLVLNRFGTCSSITTYESQLSMQPVEVRRGPAEQIVKHVYDELSQRVRHAIAEQQPVELPGEVRLGELMDGRDWLFEGLSHHIDTTHLASTIKFSRILTESQSLDRAIELCQYGRQLHQDFHYTDEPPFEDIYNDTLSFLESLRDIQGAKVDQELQRLDRIAVEQIEKEENLDSAQWYVYLLDHVGRGEQAIAKYLEMIQAHHQTATMSRTIAPDLFWMAAKYQYFEAIKQTLQKQGDLLGYVTACTIEQQQIHDETRGI